MNVNKKLVISVGWINMHTCKNIMHHALPPITRSQVVRVPIRRETSNNAHSIIYS